MPGPQVPLPIMAASTAAWRDEAHVDRQPRAAIAEKFRLAQRMLGNRAGFRVPEGGFFLWLDVGNGEEDGPEAVARGGRPRAARRLYGTRN